MENRIRDSMLPRRPGETLMAMLKLRIAGITMAGTLDHVAYEAWICKRTASRHIRELIAAGALSKGPLVETEYGREPSYQLKLTL